MATFDDSEPPAEEPLPFSGDRQEAVLGHLLLNERFFLQCKDRIKPAWFNKSTTQLIWATLQQYYLEYHIYPKQEDVFQHTKIQCETQQRKNLINLQIQTCCHNASVYALEPIIKELTEWLHARHYMDGVYQSKDLFNRRQFRESYNRLQQTCQDIRDTRFGDERVYDFTDPEAILAKREENVDSALTWGLKTFNELLLPEGKGRGCLLPGTSTTIVAPVGSGKTTLMITVACANIAYGKKVLWVPHEGDPTELQAKFLCCMLDRDLPWLRTHFPLLSKKDLDEREAKTVAYIRRFQALLQKNLVFMPMIRAGLTVEAVVAAIRTKQEELKASWGYGYDLVVDDYPAKLTTEEASGGRLEHRHKLEIIYAQLNRLAEELGYHNLNAAQTNREGSKINKGFKGYEKRLLEIEDFAEAFGPMADTATVITANRDPVAEQQNRLSLHCAKSRTSHKGWTVVCRTAYNRCISHSENLGATWYRGTATGSERMDQLLDLYRGQEIPHNVEM